MTLFMPIIELERLHVKMIKVKIATSVLSYDLKFDRRISVIKGNSASGKTTLVTAIQSIRDTDEGSIESTLPIILGNNDRWETDLLTCSNCIIIYDEFKAFSTAKFNSMTQLLPQKNIYLLLITRVDSLVEFEENNYNKRKKAIGGFSYSVNSIYKFSFNISTRTYINEPYYDYPVDNKSQPDIILVEDSTAGFAFFKRLFKNTKVVAATNGKSSICDDLLELSKVYNNILVLVDLAAFGCHMYDFNDNFKKSSFIVRFVDKYECFEYFLLTTNLVNHIDEVQKVLASPDEYANDANSWENYFEELLQKVTYHKLYKQGHSSKLNVCYVKDCDECNEKKRSNCDRVLLGNKFKELLKGTKFEVLLTFM